MKNDIWWSVQNLPSNKSLSSLRASRLSFLNCRSISALIRFCSCCSSDKQQAILTIFQFNNYWMNIRFVCQALTEIWQVSQNAWNQGLGFDGWWFWTVPKALIRTRDISLQQALVRYKRSHYTSSVKFGLICIIRKLPLHFIFAFNLTLFL